MDTDLTNAASDGTTTNFVSQPLLGAAIMGEILTTTNIKVLAAHCRDILAEDRETKMALMAFFFFKQYDRVPPPDLDWSLDEHCIAEYVKIKTICRQIAQNIMDMLARDLEENIAPNHPVRNQDELRKFFKPSERVTNLPHPEGTVDEIAKKYDLSKSQVRKMKREGTLDAFLQDKKSQ